jgi:threonine synthase
MRRFEGAKAMQLTNAQRKGAAVLFASGRADEDETAQAIRWAYESCGEIVDPHTAIGLHAARHAGLPVEVPVITLATAHPAKFPGAVERVTGIRPQLPVRVGDLFAREEACVDLPGTYEAVRNHILNNAA